LKKSGGEWRGSGVVVEGEWGEGWWQEELKFYTSVPYESLLRKNCINENLEHPANSVFISHEE
jgi:hypothetical protein